MVKLHVDGMVVVIEALRLLLLLVQRTRLVKSPSLYSSLLPFGGDGSACNSLIVLS